MDFERIEEAQSELDDAWSVSRLKVIGTCGRQYKFKYIDKVSQVITGPLAFGSAVHKSLELMETNNLYDDPQWQRLWSDTWFEYSKTVDWEAERTRKGTYDNLGPKLLSQYAERDREDIVAVEVPFLVSTKTGLPSLKGVVDKLYHTKTGRLVLIDYKTSKMPPEEMLLRADPQFTIYHAVIKKEYGEEPLLGLHHLRTNTIHWTERTDKDIELIERMMNEGKVKVEAKMFERNIGYHCGFCPYKEECLGRIKDGNID